MRFRRGRSNGSVESARIVNATRDGWCERTDEMFIDQKTLIDYHLRPSILFTVLLFREGV